VSKNEIDSKRTTDYWVEREIEAEDLEDEDDDEDEELDVPDWQRLEWTDDDD
jgi:hypothetical protein